MKPPIAYHRLSPSHLSRREWLSIGGLILFAGCTGPAIRSQSPEDAELAAIEAQVQLIGDVASPMGLNYIRIEAPALVTGLKDTGSDPPPSAQRTMLVADMQARGVVNINQVLASPTTSLVWAQAYIPPGAQKGDVIDVEVRVPPNHETTDLSGGWMMETRLREKAILGGAVKDGHVMAIAEGAVLVDPVMQSVDDKSVLLRGRVLGGAKVLKTRNLKLILKREEKSKLLTRDIGDALNRRFHSFSFGNKKGVANPVTDEVIDLVIHPRYQHNIPRYLKVIQSLAIRETPTQQLARLEWLQRQLLDPITSSTAALKLEAIGKEGIRILRKGLESSDAEVRFYAAEALAYLDDSHAAKPLAESANEPAFRVFALTALSTMQDVSAADELKTLLNAESAETRYGAFRALWGMDRNDALVKGENLHNKLMLHVLPSSAAPMVHVTRSVRPEIVLFGQDQRMQTPFTLEAGKSVIVRGESPDRVVVSRFAVGEPDRQLIVSNRLDEIIRAIIEVGGHYPDVVQLLHSAKIQGRLPGRFEVDAIPQAGRPYNRKHSTDAGDDSQFFEVLGSLPNLFGRRAEPGESDSTSGTGSETGTN
jgi:flagellar P-ring protein FlgI